MVSFRQVEFYDVPQLIALRYRGKRMLLESAFSNSADFGGKIRVGAAKFDLTRRKAMHPSILDPRS